MIRNKHIKRSVFALAFLFSVYTGFAQSFTNAELLGKIDPAKDSAFALIERQHSSKSNIYLRKEAYEAFRKMHIAALKEGVTLTIISATRTFSAQKAIWEKKWVRPEYKGWPDEKRITDIMKYSSMPGTSRHHWGTDIDMNALENNYFSSGAGKKTYEWLKANAHFYGFYQTYTAKDKGRTGYEEEKWHWSYMPLAQPMLKAYKMQVTYKDITGFSGSESAEKLNIISTYVLGIELPAENPEK